MARLLYRWEIHGNPLSKEVFLKEITYTCMFDSCRVVHNGLCMGVSSKNGMYKWFQAITILSFEIGEPSCQARTSEPPVDEQKGSIWFTNIWARFCRSLPVRQELYSSWVDLGLQKSSNAIQTPGIIMSVGDFLSHYIHCYIHDHTCIHAHNRTYIQTYSFTLSMPIYGGLSIDMLNCCGLNCWDSSLETSIPTPQNMIPRRWCSLGLSWFIEAPNWNNYT